LLTCKEFLQELNDYLDESIDLELRKRLEAHITECPNCFVIFDTTKRTIQVYKGMHQQNIPDDVRTRLMQALEKKCAQKKEPRSTLS
jgi:anti-sigma factor (TIGR02949 family)